MVGLYPRSRLTFSGPACGALLCFVNGHTRTRVASDAAKREVAFTVHGLPGPVYVRTMRHTDTTTNVLTALGSGLAGAATLNVIHETVRRIRPDDAPRMDTYGRRSLARGMEMAGITPPSKDALQGLALAGDVLSNSLYYALIGMGSPEPRRALVRGAVLGAAAGIGAVVLPPIIGLGSAPSRRTPQTKAMSFSWYFIGGLVAAGAWSLLGSRRR